MPFAGYDGGWGPIACVHKYVRATNILIESI